MANIDGSFFIEVLLKILNHNITVTYIYYPLLFNIFKHYFPCFYIGFRNNSPWRCVLIM